MGIDPNSEEFKKIKLGTKGIKSITPKKPGSQKSILDPSRDPLDTSIGFDIKFDSKSTDGKLNSQYNALFNAYKSPEFAEQLKQYYIDMQTQNLKNHYNNLNPMPETTTTTDNLG
jgi:hypothetical protein